MLRITKKHGFNEINPNTRIIRVFEEWKYEDLFKSNAIFFPSINNLREKEPLERAIPECIFDRLKLNEKQFYRAISENTDKTFTSFVSCWSKRECKELWENYDKDKNGFAISTTVGKLLNELNSNYFFPCEEDYIEINNEKIAVKMPFVTFYDDSEQWEYFITVKEKFKNGDFIDDHEIRFIGYERAKENWKKISVNLNNIIDYAIINPFASDINHRKIYDFLTEHKITINPSELI